MKLTSGIRVITNRAHREPETILFPCGQCGPWLRIIYSRQKKNDHGPHGSEVQLNQEPGCFSCVQWSENLSTERKHQGTRQDDQ
jgi:hypothetical protein